MRPMLATPTPHVPSGPAWRHEVKWDGIRAIVTVRGGEVTIATRSGADCSARFPEITGSHLRDFDDLVLDGEIVALTNGRPDFRAVMHR
ncbi:ATP-dependent DNA ligase, partial [Dermacoccus nishinomiyaensis]|uniref:ATP-dependent DNA ligase n=2 Tax=Dermacoccaceae TaxID=145357 RepID=UPI00406C6EF9